MFSQCARRPNSESTGVRESGFEKTPIRGAHYGAEITEKGAQIGAVVFALRRRNLHQFALSDPHRPALEVAGNSEENAAFDP